MAKQKSLELDDGPLTGQKIYWWKVGKRLPTSVRQAGKRLYQCRCKCGTEKTVADYNLTRGMSKSCGCRPFTIKRTGKRFTPRFHGNFYVKSIDSYKKSGKGQFPIYNIECTCGKSVKIAGLNYKYQIGCSRDCPHTLASRKRALEKKRSAK